MKRLRLPALSLLLSLVVWTVMAWPVPRYACSGIASSARGSDDPVPRRMVPGDHLQFLYHMWLAQDTFFGPTPLFHNLYEFNTGDDAERRDPALTYYLPFTLAYSAFAALGGMAFGWNMTGLLSIWITVAATWLLLRRYTRRTPEALLAAACAAALPYRWFALLGGSPSGLAMAWPPLILLGLDVMVRDRRLWGGLLAGAGIYFAEWVDAHVFFFGALVTPAWCLTAYLYDRRRFWPRGREWWRLLRAALPLLAAALLAALRALSVRADLGDTVLATGHRPLHVVQSFSPSIRGVFAWRPGSTDAHIALGFVMAALLVLAAAAALLRACRARRRWRALAVLMLLAGIAGVAFLATGPNNPLGPGAWARLTRLLPPFGMIRQAAKIYVLMPTLCALLLGWGLPALLARLGPRTRALLCLAAGLLVLAEYRRHMDPAVCLLDREQGAYRAIIDDAASRGVTPRALALPLWPGNSHWTSLNQYYAARYRLRLVNGYRPTARNRYVERVYLPFESFNKGGYSDAQLDRLLEWGVDYLLLHENAFPEKVSPFGVSHTLYQLLDHPRIAMVGHDGPAWSFRIVDPPEGIHPDPPSWTQRLPARLWQAEACEGAQAEVRSEQYLTSGGRFVRVYAGGCLVTPDYPLPHTWDLAALVRHRGGPGRVDAEIEGRLAGTDLPASPRTWTWTRVPLPAFEGYRTMALTVSPDGGTPLDVDLALLTAGDWDRAPPDPAVFPAPVLFHAGHTELGRHAVALLPDRDPADVVAYGPKLPFPAGRYRVELQFSTDAPDGTVLGELRPRYAAGDTRPVPVVAGRPAVLSYQHPANLRLAVDFAYSRAAPMDLLQLVIAREPPAPSDEP